MISVKEGLYRRIDFSTFDVTNETQGKRKALLEKEEVYPFHCNYKKLEEVCRNYKYDVFI